MDSHTEKPARSLVKTLSWRVAVLVLDFSIAFLFTQDFDLAGKLAFTKLIIASLFYYLHERFWNRVNWGKS